ncbi:hypothetical protein E3U43_007293 [Larimichthys crocea]|uniref:Uncharacterized protein n=1 Tax=Larimichthys crocea TaxID=215358 RepID=A0ACD3RN83_LARCR|nr:hypothetical protein E3U43_007293 [Larimichthys crocea]
MPCKNLLKTPTDSKDLSVLVKGRLYFQQALCRSCKERTARVTVGINNKGSTSKNFRVHSESKIQRTLSRNTDRNGDCDVILRTV